MAPNRNESPPFSCDLVANARLHVLFLRAVHLSGVSLRRPSAESIRRYKDLWLPLVASSTAAHGVEQLIPPIDVAWLWHCHRLAPYDYGRYVRKELGVDKYLDANPPFALQCAEGAVVGHDGSNDAANHTRELWAMRYADEPFFYESNTKEQSSDGYGMLHNFDLVDSCERQATFLWQVTQERFGDEEFLQDGVDAYNKFLKLRSTKDGKDQIIVPTYQIDLMWHTHILSSLARYDVDCKMITGRTLHHDDSLNDRSEGSTLNRAFDATKQIWEEIYKEEYVVVGGMYRGEPPKEYYSNEWAMSHLDGGSDELKWSWPVISPEIEGTKVNWPRIMGASSTGNSEYVEVGFGTLDGGKEGEDRLEEGPWLSPKSILPNGDKCFIEATQSKASNAPGTINNPKKDNYIFGRGELGLGYYHIKTKEAYKILMVRVDKRIRNKEGDFACINLWTFCCPTSSKAREKQANIRAELQELAEARGVLEARYRADTPHGIVGLPQDITTNPARKDVVTKYYDEGGGWIFPIYFYDAGGGCGAAIDGLGLGGGCGTGGGWGGGGGCGGGGCGGGGCGGGGCGGC